MISPYIVCPRERFFIIIMHLFNFNRSVLVLVIIVMFVFLYNIIYWLKNLIIRIEKRTKTVRGQNKKIYRCMVFFWAKSWIKCDFLLYVR